MKNALEMEKFLSYTQTLRSELQGHVKNNSAILLSEFNDITKEDYEDVADLSAPANNTRFCDLLGYNALPTATHPQYPGICPLISLDGDEFPFGTENIAKAQARAETPERHKACNADNWDIKEITPNMIAVEATMIRYLLFPDRTFTALETHSKIDWISACTSYKKLLINNKDTPGIVSLFEILNSRLFRGQVVPAQQLNTPAPDNIFSTPVDASLQYAITLLQSRQPAPLPNVYASEPATPTLNAGASSLSRISSPVPPDLAELPTASKDQVAAAYAEDLIRNALNADSEASSDEDDSSDDENDALESISASSAPQPKPAPRSRLTPNNLATIASTAQLPPAPSLPTPLNTPNNATSTAGRASKRKAEQPNYADLNEDGKVDGSEQKKRKKGANSAKAMKKSAGSGKGKGASAVGSGSKPPATERPKRIIPSRAK